MLLLSYCSVFKVQNWKFLPRRSRKWSFLCLLSCSQESKWWAWEDSNLRPHAYQACALTTWATSPFDFRRPVVVSVFRRPVVEMRRIELLTPCLQGRCSPSWATPPNFTLVNFDEVRIFFDVVAYSLYARPRKNSKFAKLVGLSGLEPPTSRLSGVRSNRLSYRPMQGFYWVQFPFPTYINILCFKCSCFHMYIQR